MSHRTAGDEQVLFGGLAGDEANAGHGQAGRLASKLNQLIHALLGVGVKQLPPHTHTTARHGCQAQQICDQTKSKCH